MQWTDWNDFWHMGGHGAYVWGAYAFTVALLVAEWVSLRQHARTTSRTTRAAKGMSR